MDLYDGNEYIILYLVYGLAFFVMGISAFLQRRGRSSNFLILNNLSYLGWFGVLHGITEWILMIYIADFYPEHRMRIYFGGMMLNVLSFFFLFLFGLKSLEEEKGRKFMAKVPYVLLFIWTGSFLAIIFRTGLDADPIYSVMSAFSRYFIGFPAAVLTYAALSRSARKIRNIGLTSIADGIRRLGILFLVYGVLAGIIVRKNIFFPGTVINNELFRTVFLIPVELARAAAAVLITLLFTRVIELFNWENNKNIERLIEERAISFERKKMARDIHDNIIQNLFASGLRLERILEKQTDEKDRKDLMEIKTGLNENIDTLRTFIGIIKSSRVGLDDFYDMLLEVSQRFSGIDEEVHVTLDYQVPEVTIGHLSNKSLTQLFYVIQEAVSNAVKHAGAREIEIRVKAGIECIEAIVSDDGKGFDLYDTLIHSEGYGLTSMQERVKSVRGLMEIGSDDSGTTIRVKIPWEERRNEEKS